MLPFAQAFILNSWVSSGKMHRVDAFLVPGIFNLPAGFPKWQSSGWVRGAVQLNKLCYASKRMLGLFEPNLDNTGPMRCGRCSSLTAC